MLFSFFPLRRRSLSVQRFLPRFRHGETRRKKREGDTEARLQAVRFTTAKAKDAGRKTEVTALLKWWNVEKDALAVKQVRMPNESERRDGRSAPRGARRAKRTTCLRRFFTTTTRRTLWVLQNMSLVERAEAKRWGTRVKKSRTYPPPR